MVKRKKKKLTRTQKAIAISRYTKELNKKRVIALKKQVKKDRKSGKKYTTAKQQELMFGY